MTEITFLVDARETLIKKIDETQIILQTNIVETGMELKTLVNDITELFEKKLRLIEGKYNKQTDELDQIKTELKTKKFDESNFNNVSWIKNQDTQIKERDNKIRELEGRIKFLETKANVVVKVAVPVVEPVAEPVAEPVVEPAVELVVEPVVEADPVIETKAKGKSTSKKEPKVTTKKPIKVKKNIEIELIVDNKGDREIEDLVVEPVVEEPKGAREAEALVVEPVIEPFEETVVEPVVDQVIEPVVKSIVELKSKLKKEPKVTTKKPIKLKKTIEAEPVSEERVARDASVLVVEPVAEPTIKNIVDKGARGAEALVLAPDIKDLDLLELNDVNYYKDKLDNVYQMTEDEDIGIFLGVYDSSSNKIITIT